MPDIPLGSLGLSVHFTGAIPDDVVNILWKEPNERIDAGLVPSWGVMPYHLSGDLRRRGISIPPHWPDNNVIWPVVPSVGFGLELHLPFEVAVATVAFRGKNILTGLAESDAICGDKRTHWHTSSPLIASYIPNPGHVPVWFVGNRAVESRLSSVSQNRSGSVDGLSVWYYLVKEPQALHLYHASRLSKNQCVIEPETGQKPFLQVTHRLVSYLTFNEWAAAFGQEDLALSPDLIRKLMAQQYRFESEMYDRYLPNRPIRVEMTLKKSEDA